MAVYTKLSENELKDFFSKYNLGELINFSGIKEGKYLLKSLAKN